MDDAVRAALDVVDAGIRDLARAAARVSKDLDLLADQLRKAAGCPRCGAQWTQAALEVGGPTCDSRWHIDNFHGGPK